MEEREVEQDNKTRTFQYRGLVLVVLWTATVFFMSLFLAIVAILNDAQHKNITQAVIFVLLASVFILAVAWVLIASRSDIKIDAKGISRSIFGVVWQAIEWRNIKVIRCFPTSRGAGEASKSFSIHPLARPKFSLALKGIMVFSNQFDEVDELLNLLNEYIRLHNIRVEISNVRFGGDWIEAQSL